MDELKYQTPSELSVGQDAREIYTARGGTDPDFLNNAAHVIRAFVISKLTQKQFDALVLLVAFAGPNQFYHSAARDRVNRSEYRAAASMFLVMDSHLAPYRVDQDLAMRVQERALFLEGTK